MIKEFILKELQKNYDLDSNVDLDNLNFVEEGYVTSLGLLQFMVTLEEKYKIRFSDEEVMSENFQVVGKLAALIEEKIKDN